MMVSNVPLNVLLWWRLVMASHCVGSRASAEALGTPVVWDGSLDVTLQLALWWPGRLTFPPHSSCMCHLSPAVTKYWQKQPKEKGLIWAHGLRL